MLLSEVSTVNAHALYSQDSMFYCYFIAVPTLSENVTIPGPHAKHLYISPILGTVNSDIFQLCHINLPSCKK